MKINVVTVIMDIRLIIIAIETPIKAPSRGLSITPWDELVGKKVVMAVEVIVDCCALATLKV